MLVLFFIVNHQCLVMNHLKLNMGKSRLVACSGTVQRTLSFMNIRSHVKWIPGFVWMWKSTKKNLNWASDIRACLMFIADICDCLKQCGNSGCIGSLCDISVVLNHICGVAHAYKLFGGMCCSQVRKASIFDSEDGGSRLHHNGAYPQNCTESRTRRL